MKFEFEYIEKLMDLVEKHNLTELSLDDGEKAISLKNKTKMTRKAKTKNNEKNRKQRLRKKRKKGNEKI